MRLTLINNGNRYNCVIMIKKRLLFCFLLALCIVINAEGQNSQIDIGKYHNIIISLLTNLDSIIENDKSSELVHDTFMVSANAIRNNQVIFGIDSSSDSILSGMGFTIRETGEISLVFGLKYLDTFRPNSSIHYSILIHEYRHLYDYLRNKETYAAAKNNVKESYWYELDALRIEAEFIKHYLNGRYELSKFEEYVLTSFENNNLNSASVMIQRENMNMFFRLNNLENQYYNNKDMKDSIIDEMVKLGNAALENYTMQESDFVNYWNYIELRTFNKFMLRLMAILMDNPTMTWDEVFEKYPEIKNIHYTIVEIQERDGGKHNEYVSSVYQFWEEDILERVR